MAVQGKRKQDKHTPWLIRNDGLLYPNFPGVAKQSDYRPYHGDPKASLDERMAYLRGEVTRYTNSMDPDTFDIGKASRGQLVDFAEKNYGKVLDASLSIDALREQVAALAGDAGDTETEEAPAAKTRRQHRIDAGKGKYPVPGDDDAAVARAKQLATSGVGLTVPKFGEVNG